MEGFNFSEFVKEAKKEEIVPEDQLKQFYLLCEKIRGNFFSDWESRESSRSVLDLQKRAIIGYPKEREFFKTRIHQLVQEAGSEACVYPSWYESLEDAIYHENWGLTGLAQWFSPGFASSSSAKIIGDRIYFMRKGRMELMPQRIRAERRDQLIKSFLLLTPEERMDKDYYETYLLDGTRVTVFTEPMAKKNQTSIIFRRYIVPSLSFEEQARRGTIPEKAIPFFRSMVKVGYNVVFLGAVRTAKTTFLTTWQSYEDPTLEGVMVETDPEIPMDKILPTAPIVQLIADGDDLKKISKNLLRSDADYFILAEARDGIALDTAVKLAAKGTKRMKLTFHSRLPAQFPLEAATEIVKQTGGDLTLTMGMIASGFDYLFHFIQLADKSQKRLKGIYQMNLTEDKEILVEPVCLYDQQKDNWTFFNVIGKAQSTYGMESEPESFKEMSRLLEKLAEISPVKGVEHDHAC